MKKFLLAIMTFTLSGCLGMPDNVEPVSNFDAQRYMGKWYEIARLDHSFERGLSKVTAEYALQENGKISVLNRGYSAAEQQWQQAQGKAYLAGEDNQGYLKVSFFGPFYGSYVVFELADDYQYAFVSGPSTDYLWLLARTPEVSDTTRETFLRSAAALGFDTDSIIWVSHQAG